MFQGGEPLFDSGWDWPEDKDEGEVHVPHQGPPQHPGLLVKTLHKTSNRVKQPEKGGKHVVQCFPDPMVCLFLLPVIAKIPTDCLILIGCWKVSLNLIGCLKKLSRRTKCSTSLDLGSSGLYAGAYKKFVPFFWTHFISWQSVTRVCTQTYMIMCALHFLLNLQ